MKITEIKENAKIKLNGNYIKCASSSLLYFIIVSLITFFQTKAANQIENSVVLAITQAVFLLLSWILSYGIIANILDLTNSRINSITDFLNSTIKNCAKYTRIGLRILLKLLLPIILNLLAAFYWIGTQVAKINKINFLCFNQNLTQLATFIWVLAILILIYYILRYILVAYIYYENTEMSEKDIVDKSRKLMHGNKLKYLLLLLSFFHWFLIGALLLLILNSFLPINYLTPFAIFFYSVIRPYVVTCKLEFYRELDDIKEEKINTKKEA